MEIRIQVGFMFDGFMMWMCEQFEKLLIKLKFVSPDGTQLKSCRWVFYTFTIAWVVFFFAYGALTGDYIAWLPIVCLPISLFLYVQTAYYSAREITVTATLVTKYIRTNRYYRRSGYYNVTETPLFVFRTDANETIELSVDRVQYDMYKPYDRGILCYKKYRFQKFFTEFKIT